MMTMDFRTDRVRIVVDGMYIYMYIYICVYACNEYIYI